jgi:hypothetical protein
MGPVRVIGLQNNSFAVCWISGNQVLPSAAFAIDAETR